MTQQNLSRRTLAKGAAWSVPLAAASATVPAFAASGPSSPPPVSKDPCLTPEEAYSGNCERILYAFNKFLGLQDYDSIFGGDARMSHNFSISVQASCWPDRLRWMAIKLNDGNGPHSPIPRPSIVLPWEGGKKFIGRATLGTSHSGPIRTGVSISSTIQWENSLHSSGLIWKGATATIPLQFSWKDKGGVHVCIYDLKFELTEAQTSFLLNRRRMGNPRLVLHGQ